SPAGKLAANLPRYCHPRTERTGHLGLSGNCHAQQLCLQDETGNGVPPDISPLRCDRGFAVKKIHALDDKLGRVLINAIHLRPLGRMSGQAKK
ncbi:MAG: hypothetical protein OER56_03520, partial [Hyphomicrobiales bacterium]|nr:hypothetical protein [Hyphomicrobiales bacterium]